MLGLLNRRMRLVGEIAAIKRAERIPVYAPEREDQLLRGLSRRNRGPLKDGAMRAIYREVLSAARAIGQPMRIAYLGPEATFTHLAAQARFGSQAQYAPVRSTSDVFYEVDRRKSDYGVVPVENSTEGVVNYTLDMFVDSELKICAEELIPIEHMLLSRVSSLGAIRKVYSHGQVFGQCRHWIEDRLRNAQTAEVSSTAEAARLAARDPKGAAIGTELAAKIYGLRILARNVEDVPGNYTRFFVISKSWSPRTGRDKTSVMFSVKDRVGALHAMLEPFRKNRINLTSIESRPSRKRAWDYFFFLDFQGHVDDRPVARALADLEKVCMFVKLLGSYPAAESSGR